MLVCPTCSHENNDVAKFCETCGAKLEATAVREERKVVTTLFCDLVQFTAISEQVDPEDVDRMLADYFAIASRKIEAFGGVVEKYIGDAVVGAFGVPAIHGDDPERAVHAALQIVEGVTSLLGASDEPLRVRIGINTGETLVHLGVLPSSGQGFLRGDSVNTAARLQSVAPPMGVVVGQTTHDLTSRVFEYEELETVMLKGKAEPVRLFLAKAPRARLGSDVVRAFSTPFVGRDTDFSILRGVFDETIAKHSPHLLTVIGEPGIGKSRLVAELLRYVDERTELINWRQGRCLPYGDGVTYWALGEVVKAHAGIMDSDEPDIVATKLGQVVPDGPDREWMRQRLLPLLGLEASSSAEREELFTAWRRFLQGVADQSPTVLIFEDLHWADDAMLAFLEHLADRAEHVPLLMVATARPELLERRPDFGVGLRNLTPITLGPLTHEDTARVVATMAGTSVLSAGLHALILERSGGNPLYAEEFMRLMRDKNMLRQEGDRGLVQPTDLPFPGSVQSLIAARLDTLPTELKEMLADAAVVGKVFWAGAVAEMGGRQPADVLEALHELSRKELVRPVRHSSMAGEIEYSFWHVLSRDVAYAQLPRPSRIAKHTAAAGWIENKAGKRVEDLAEVLAYHYTTSLELARATADADQVSFLEPRALRFLILAGERALGLDTATALADLRRTLDLMEVHHPDRPRVLSLFADAAAQAGHRTEAAHALEEAIEAFRRKGNLPALAHGMITLSGVLRRFYDQRGFELPREALSLLESLPPGPELVEALTEMAAMTLRSGAPVELLAWADRAISLARELGLERPAAALGYRGIARCYLQDPAGLQDCRDALQLAIDRGHGEQAARLYNELGATLSDFEGPVRATEVWREGSSFADRRGIAEWALLMEMNIGALGLVETGSLDEALETLERVGEKFVALGDNDSAAEVDGYVLEILLLRGDAGTDELRRSLARIDRGLAEMATSDVDSLLFVLNEAAQMRSALGDDEETAIHLEQIVALPRAGWSELFPPCLPRLVRIALAHGDSDMAARLVGRAEPNSPYAENSMLASQAAIAESRGEREEATAAYSEAAIRWEAFGHVIEQAFALLGLGRCLLGLSKPAQAVEALSQAERLFALMRLRPALAETESLIRLVAGPDV
jgi:class 3 adenylate cyclase/tetratricopeptide (TPR) repeat protein